MKINLSVDALQQSLIRHVEKIVFGLCLVLFLVLVVLGFRAKGYNKTPPQIEKEAASVQKSVEESDPWEQIKNSPERVTLTRYSEVVKEGNLPTEGGLYVYKQPLNPFVPRPLIKRQDPELFPPVKVIVRSLNAAIAYRNSGELPDRLGELKTVKLEASRPKPKDDRRSGRSIPPGSMPPGYGDEFGMGDDSGDAAGGLPFMGEGPPPPGYGGTGPSSPVGTGGSGPKIFRHPDGWRPGGITGMFGGMTPGMPGMSGPPGVSRGGTSSPAAVSIYPKPSRVMVVMALIEYEKQVDEFKLKFENAAGYDPRRDQPNYVAIAVERAEVPADPNVPLVWQQIGSTATALREQAQWAGTYDEVAHPLYVLPNRTTMAIPPIFLRNVEEFVVHPEIPRRTQQIPTTVAAGGTGAATAGAGTQPSDADSDVPSDVPPTGYRGMAGFSAPPGMPGYPASGMPGVPASGMPGVSGAPGVAGIPGMPSAPPGLSPYGGGAEGMDSDAGPGLAPGMGGMAPGAAGYPGMAGMSGAQMTTKYKLVRFFDLTAEPGKLYRYRVQLLVEDPNHPQNPLMDVPARLLSDEVAARVTDLQAKEPKEGARRYYYRRSDWSEPSEPVSVEPEGRFYVGPVARPNVSTHKNGAILVRDPLQMSGAVVRWDHNWAVDVAIKKEMIPGTVFNEVRNVEVVHPITLEFKLIDKYDLRTNCALVDVRGGEKVGGDSLQPLLSPTEALFLDAEGRLVVRNEVEDLDLFRRFTYADETDTGTGSGGRPRAPGMPGEPGSMEPGGMGAPGGMFPPSGPPGQRGRERGRGSRPPRGSGS